MISIIFSWGELCPWLSRRWQLHRIHRAPWTAQVTRIRSATNWGIIGHLSHVVSLTLPARPSHSLDFFIRVFPRSFGNIVLCANGAHDFFFFSLYRRPQWPEQCARDHMAVKLIQLFTVHCRRRKIRCLVAADDAQGRCENCIRLRKECQFFPVDQQPPIEKKSRPSSRLETAPTDPTTTTPISSSPTNLNPDSVDAFYPYPQIPLNASSSAQDMSAYNPAAFAGHPMSGFTPGRLDFFDFSR